jgi:phage antirepressor YoqD-like protein
MEAKILFPIATCEPRCFWDLTDSNTESTVTEELAMAQPITFNFKEVTTILGTYYGKNKLYQMLRVTGILYSDNSPQRHLVSLGYFVTKIKTRKWNPRHFDLVCLVTEAGIEYIKLKVPNYKEYFDGYIIVND